MAYSFSLATAPFPLLLLRPAPCTAAAASRVVRPGDWVPSPAGGSPLIPASAGYNVLHMAWSGAFKKLLEVVEMAGVYLIEPSHRKRLAKIEEETTVKQAKADAKALLIRDRALVEGTRLRAKAMDDAQAMLGTERFDPNNLTHRASYRLAYQTLDRQQNVEAVIEGAVETLPSEVSAEPIDPDWVSAFFEICQDVSDSQMRMLWSRILAGEVAHPHSFSLRTLHAVKVLDKEDAQLFSEFSRRVVVHGDGASHFWIGINDWYLQHVGIRYGSVLHLESIGLVNATPGTVRRRKEGALVVNYFGKRFSVGLPQHERLPLNCYPVTAVGFELLPLAQAEEDSEYLRKLLEGWKASGYSVTEVPAE